MTFATRGACSNTSTPHTVILRFLVSFFLGEARQVGGLLNDTHTVSYDTDFIFNNNCLSRAAPTGIGYNYYVCGVLAREGIFNGYTWRSNNNSI